jgi:hypothetical protein
VRQHQAAAGHHRDPDIQFGLGADEFSAGEASTYHDEMVQQGVQAGAGGDQNDVRANQLNVMSQRTTKTFEAVS